MNLVPENINEAIKHLQGVSLEDVQEKVNALVKEAGYTPAMKSHLNRIINDELKENKRRLHKRSVEFLSNDLSLIKMYMRYDWVIMNTQYDPYIIENLMYVLKALIEKYNLKDKVNEAFDYHRTYLQIYKNNDPKDYYNYIVLKGNSLFHVRLVKGEKWTWKYSGEIEKDKYIINGTLVANPPMKLIVIFQKYLKK